MDKVEVSQRYGWLAKFRDPISGLTHLFGAFLAAAGLVALLVIGWGSTPRILSLLVYGLSLVGLFSASAAYHLVIGSPETILALRKLDHASIYLLIAGSYTPFCVNAFTGFWQWGLLAVIWSLAAVGIAVKLFTIHAPRGVSAGLYLLMGWLSIAGAGEMAKALPPASLTWLVIGGLAYTSGAVVYITKKLDFVPGIFGFHEVWHLFVLAGAAAHFIAIVSYFV